MHFENKYVKKYIFFELFCRGVFLIVVDFDLLLFFIDPQMFIDFFSIFTLLFDVVFAIFMIYNMILITKPKVIIKDDCLYVYLIDKLNVKRKYLLKDIKSVVVNSDENYKKYNSKAEVISISIDGKIINFALDKNDCEKFVSLIKM